MVRPLPRFFAATLAATLLFALACKHQLQNPTTTGGQGVPSNVRTAPTIDPFPFDPEIILASAGGAGGNGQGGQGQGQGDGGAGGGPGKMSCGDAAQFRLPRSPGYPDSEYQTNLAAAQAIRNTLSLTEKADEMRGVFSGFPTGAQYSDIQRSYDNKAKGIRGWQYRDGPRGVNYDQPMAVGDSRGAAGNVISQHAYSTVFPVPVARGASFDVELEYRIGMAMGDETVAGSQTVLLVPCVNVLRHPFWGRAQETYGEDVFHLGRIGTGLTVGVQEYVAACAKHFAANNIEVNRSGINSELDEQTLREIYGRHFDMIVNDGGVACIMAAYNSVNGTKSTQNKTLLNDILRNEFKFKGYVISDWWAMPGSGSNTDPTTRRSYTSEALAAGMDLEVPWAHNYAVLDAPGSMFDLNPHVDRLLAQKIRFNAHSLNVPVGLRRATTTFSPANVDNDYKGGISGNERHIALAEEAAVKSMVLLKNCPASNLACAAPEATSVLPINRVNVSSVAVVGATLEYCQATGLLGINNCTEDRPNLGKINFATGVRVGDVGSSRVTFDPNKAIGPFAGIQAAAGGSITVTTATTDGSDTSAAVAAARAADFVVVVTGLTPYDEGEEYNAGGDRQNLRLDGKDTRRGYGMVQDKLVMEVAALGKPMVVVIEAGSAVEMPWLSTVPAVVMAWYPGQAGGNALGKLLFGDANFSGKLPITWPKDVTQLPTFNEGPTTRMDYFLGYRRFDLMNLTPLYPFGHGLSYATFQYSNLQVPCTDVSENGVVKISVDVRNTGARAGDETVMAFVSFPTGPNGTPRRSIKELKGFRRVSLAAAGSSGDAKRITIPIRVQDLKYFDVVTKTWRVQPGTYTVRVGPNAADLPLTDTFVVN